MYWGTTNTATTTTGWSGSSGGVIYINVNSWNVPPPPPPRPKLDEANMRWVKATVGARLTMPRTMDPREPQRLRTWLETLGFSPSSPFDPVIARTTYRRLMRESHPDLGGDPVVARRVTAAWTELKARGFVR